MLSEVKVAALGVKPRKPGMKGSCAFSPSRIMLLDKKDVMGGAPAASSYHEDKGCIPSMTEQKARRTPDS